MLIELGVVIASIIPVMTVGKAIAIQLSEWRWIIPIVQSFVGAVFGLLAVAAITSLSQYVIIIVTFLPWIININSILYKNHQTEKALGGGYGEEVQWASELVDEGDALFTMAINDLPEREMKEVGIIAESKEELRDLTIERYDEHVDDTVPEDFGQ